MHLYNLVVCHYCLYRTTNMLNVYCIFTLSGSLPVTQKQGIFYPRLKKTTLDIDNPCSFRPISNLSFISKLVKRMVTSRFVLNSENKNSFQQVSFISKLVKRVVTSRFVLNSENKNSFQPVSFISKLVKRVVTSRFVLHSENKNSFQPVSQLIASFTRLKMPSASFTTT